MPKVKVAPMFTKEDVRARIATSTLSVEKAILSLYEKQTEAEQMTDSTNQNNGVGFNGTDAFILGRFAKWIQGSYKTPGSRLSDKQLAIARRKLPKYAAQLIRIAEEKMAQKVTQAA